VAGGAAAKGAAAPGVRNFQVDGARPAAAAPLAAAPPATAAPLAAAAPATAGFAFPGGSLGFPSIDHALAAAVQHHQSGRVQAAEEIYQRVLAQEPRHPGAWHLLGVAAAQTGRIELAASHYQ